MGMITLLEYQKRRKNRVNVYVDGEFYIGLPSIVVGERRIKVGDEIDEAELREIALNASREEAWNCALDYATRRMRTEREVVRHLESKGYPNECAREACEKLQEYGYLDEDAFVRAYIADHRTLWGKMKIEYELKGKGVSFSKIEDALADLDQTETCRALAKKYALNKPADAKTKAKIANYLYSRGFEWDVIRAATEGLDHEQEID